MLGESRVEIAPYEVIESVQDSQIELRNYERMVLVSTSMQGEDRNGAFRRLFAYISGDNAGAREIAMTAPVFMDEARDDEAGLKIPMTAPVFMDDEGQAGAMMSFVMPADFTLDTTPAPNNDDVIVSEVQDYKVAVIRFNGRLSENNTQKHRDILEQWIIDNGYVVTGAVKTAGYNAPFTLPAARRNEVLIPVVKK